MWTVVQKNNYHELEDLVLLGSTICCLQIWFLFGR